MINGTSKIKEAEFNLGVIYEILGENNHAIKCYERVISIDPKHIFTYNLPTAFVTLNDLLNKDSSNQPFRIINNNMNFKIDNLTSVDNGDDTTTINIFFSHNFINRKNQLKSSNVVDTNYNGGLTFNSSIFYEYLVNNTNGTITIDNFGSIPLDHGGQNFKSNSSIDIDSNFS